MCISKVQPFLPQQIEQMPPGHVDESAKSCQPTESQRDLTAWTQLVPEK